MELRAGPPVHQPRVGASVVHHDQSWGDAQTPVPRLWSGVTPVEIHRTHANPPARRTLTCQRTVISGFDIRWLLSHLLEQRDATEAEAWALLVTSWPSQSSRKCQALICLPVAS
jgi:hypothetical protein